MVCTVLIGKHLQDHWCPEGVTVITVASFEWMWYNFGNLNMKIEGTPDFILVETALLEMFKSATGASSVKGEHHTVDRSLACCGQYPAGASGTSTDSC